LAADEEEVFAGLVREIGVGGTGGVHVVDTHGCDGVDACAPQQVGFWHSDFWLGFFVVNRTN